MNPNNTNGTMDDERYDFEFLFRTFFISEMVSAFLALSFNITVMVIFMRMISQNRFRSSNCMLFIQSLTDLTVTISLLLTAMMGYVHFEVSQLFYTVWIFAVEASQYLAVNTLVLITLDRFLAIQYPYFHRLYGSRKTLVVAVLFIVLLSTIPSIISITFIIPNEGSTSIETEDEFENGTTLNESMDQYERYELLKLKYHVTMGVIAVTEILLVFYMLISSYSTVRQNIRSRIKTHCRQHTSEHNISLSKKKMKVDSEKRKHRRIILILAGLCSIYTITYLPYAILRVCYYPFLNELLSNFLAEVLSHSLAFFYFSTAFINPLTTLTFKEDYRVYLVKCWKVMRMFGLCSSLKKETKNFPLEFSNETEL